MSCFKVPRIFRKKDINFKDLSIDDDEVNETIKTLREKYAQEALILFLPFQKDSDLCSSFDNTYWTSFLHKKRLLCGKKGLKFFKIIKICSI